MVDLSGLEELDFLDDNDSGDSRGDILPILRLDLPKRSRSRDRATAKKASTFVASTDTAEPSVPKTLRRWHRESIQVFLRRVIQSKESVLDLSREGLEDSDLLCLLDALRIELFQEGQHVLRSILLTRNNLTDSSACALAEAIRSGEHWAVNVVELSLNQNQIGDHGIMDLVDALRQMNADDSHSHNKTVLQKVDISWNGDIELSTKLSLARELIVNIRRLASSSLSSSSSQTLTRTLYLHGQAFGDEGIKYLCDNLLCDDTSVKSLYLGDQDVREGGARSLISLLQKNFTLTHIDLEENYDLEPTFKEEIASYIMRNRSLPDFYLGRYVIDEGPPIHVSQSSIVKFAKDMKTVPPTPVALKIMHHKDEFERELKQRFDVRTDATSINGGSHHGDIDACVISVLGYHSEIEHGFEHLRRDSSMGVGGNFVLVLAKASRSLFHVLGVSRVAGYDHYKSMQIFRDITLQVKALHAMGIAHGDLKPRNILFYEDDTITLCDLDASVKLGERRESAFLKCSTAYSPPELYRSLQREESLVMSEEFDVWSLGVILFEILSGRHLFAQDISNDSLIQKQDMRKLCLWSCINDGDLQTVCNNSSVSADVRGDARALIRWCLQGDAARRPTIEEILNHSLLGMAGRNVESPQTMRRVEHEAFTIMGEVEVEEEGKEEGGELFTQQSSVVENRSDERCKQFGRMKYHFFISHYQMEASGDVGTLYYLFESIGMNAWRDMNVSNLTEDNMRQGVLDSEIFLLFLTNACISRYFCLKEIGWAIEYKKPIIIIVEEEERFFAWNMERWMDDRCSRGSDFKWERGYLQTPIASVKRSHPEVYSLIHLHQAQNLMLPFRRREFEMNALVGEILRRASMTGKVSWSLPESTLGLSNIDDISAKQCHSYYMVSDPDLSSIIDEMKEMVAEATCNMSTFTGNMVEATRCIVFLSKDTISKCHDDLSYLANSMQSNQTSSKNKEQKIIFVYSIHDGWDFGKFYTDTPDGYIKSMICDHEALTYRHVSHERKALIGEILRRSV